MIDNTTDNMADINPRMNAGAVSVYGADAPTDEFPVLKAFQQYIDAEQAKSRKRMILLCIFFSFLMLLTIGVFVVLLIASSSRNQSLNDRLVEYLMKDRDRAPIAAPVVQNQQNDALIDKLTSKMESLQKALDEERALSEKNAAEVARAKQKTAEELEIERLKSLLSAEKEKSAEEREKKRQAELEAYRRKHYPEAYGLKPKKTVSRTIDETADEAADREIEALINDIRDMKPISYFDDEKTDSESKPTAKRETTSTNPLSTDWSFPEE